MLSAIAVRYLGDWTEVFRTTGHFFYFWLECTKDIVLSVQRERESYHAVLVQDPKDAERLILYREQLVVQNPKDDTKLEKIEMRTGKYFLGSDGTGDTRCLPDYAGDGSLVDRGSYSVCNAESEDE